MRRHLALLLVLVLSASVGCGKINIKDIKQENFATEAEVSDYDTKQLSYKASYQRLGDTLEYGYSLNPIDNSLATKLKEKVKIIESELGNSVYDSMTNHISEDLYHTFKALLDDKILTNGVVEQVGSSRGYYFVDKKYKVAIRNTPGQIKDTAYLLGLNGIFSEDAYGIVSIDTAYQKMFFKELNESERKIDILIDDTKTTSSDSDRGRMSLTGQAPNKKLNLGNTRRPKYNSVLANSIVGTSSKSLAVMPELTLVYVPAIKSGELSGNGIYIQGDKTLGEYGYSMDKQTGSAYVRYVFKQHITEPDTIEFVNAYIMDYTLNEIPDINTDLIVPEFVETEAKKLLNRSDRVIANADLSGLMSGSVYADIGQGILSGYLAKHSYLGNVETTLEGIVGRNIENNSYLLQVKTVISVGAKGGVDTGEYLYTGYMVMSQIGSTEFVITDYVYTKMQTMREPSVNIDDTITRQLASLNLSGEVSETTKSKVENLLSNIYKSVSGDDLSIPRYLYTYENNIGYADCFSDDTNLLPKEDKDYIISKMIGWVTKYGDNIGTLYSGFVSNWLGGTETQAEFITQELIEYPDKKVGLYLNVYYLASNYDNTFKIDEMKPLTSKVVTGEELEQIKQRIENKQDFTVDLPDNEDISLANKVGTKNIIAQREAEKSETN